MSGRIAVDRSAGERTASIVIDHPERENAITPRMAAQFCEALTALERDDAVKVVVIKGAGANLTSGADLTAVAQRFAPPDGEAKKPLSQRARFADADLWWGRAGLFGRVLYCPKITIVAAHGKCHGAGLHLALYADLAIASATAAFAMPEWRHAGVNGDLSMLVAAVGLKRAKELVYWGREWDAATAMSHGLVNAVVASDRHDAATAELAQCCAMIMRDAVAAEKQVVRAALARMQVETGLAAAAVVGAWGTNIHFRQGEFNLLRAAKHDGLDAAVAAGAEHFAD
ncbi:MAG TPA: enoyl-CoA hydratase/isomerase family protein [Rhizomicrobium sp.]